MKDRNFIDSNILIYAHTMQDERKKKIAHKILSSDLAIFGNTQVINESINVFIKRFKIPLIEIKNIIDQILLYLPVKTINSLTIQSALGICEKYQYSYYDSLIVSSALQNDCSTLYSEDLQHNQKIENCLTIINPFL
ncbi:MAG: PIN domain-containing protein [Ginsengibacter sp.]